MTEETKKKAAVLRENISFEKLYLGGLEKFIENPQEVKVELPNPNPLSPFRNPCCLYISSDVTKQCAIKEAEKIRKNIERLTKEFEALQ